MLPQWTNQVRDLARLPRWYVTSRTVQLRCQKASIASLPWKSACSTLLEPCHERSFYLYAEGSVGLSPDWVYLLQNLAERPKRPIKVEYPFWYLPLSSSTTSKTPTKTPTVSTAASTNLAQPPRKNLCKSVGSNDDNSEDESEVDTMSTKETSVGCSGTQSALQKLRCSSVVMGL